MCNIEGKWFKTNLELFFFLCTIGRLFVSVSETLRDEYRQYGKIIKTSRFSETKHFIVYQLYVFMEK